MKRGVLLQNYPEHLRKTVPSCWFLEVSLSRLSRVDGSRMLSSPTSVQRQPS